MPTSTTAMAVRIVVNAKAQRPGVCNAAETLLVHRDVAPSFLPRVAEALIEAGVELRGDDASRAARPGHGRRPARATGTPSTSTRSWPSRVVDSLDAAIAHITRHGSGHTEAILTSDLAAARRFVAEVDSSAVMVNASTRFNDGGQLGLGRRDRHQHRQVPRPRPLRPPRADQHQVGRLRRRADPRVIRSNSRNDCTRTWNRSGAASPRPSSAPDAIPPR